MTAPLRFGVVGLGYWGPNLVRNIADLPEASLEVLCDPIPVRLEKLARRYPQAASTADYRELLKNPAVEAVAIATPVSTHHALARAALLAGKHVFVEKPLAATSAQARDLHSLALRKKLTLMVDHVFVYTPAVQKIRDIIRSGELGELFYFDSVRVNLGLFQKDVNVIWDLAPHDLSIMDFLLSGRRPRAVSATAVRHIRGSGKEDLAYLTVFYDRGLIGHIHVNWLAPAKIRRILIGGAKRMVVYDDNDPVEKVKIYDKGVDVLKTHQQVEYRLGDMRAPHLDTTEALRVALRHFTDCVRRRKKSLSDGEAGTRIVRLLEAAGISAKRDGRRVTL